MKNIILYGGPASGKGTLCELLVDKYRYNHISTGELFRNLDDDTELGKIIKETIAKGDLVDDETTSQLVKNKLKTINGFIVLDGFPRNLEQARMLDEYFSNYVVINLDVTFEEALKRALGRMNCPKCGRGYNKYNPNLFPKIYNLCDDCNVELTQRNDDNEESFKNRYEIYKDNVKDILNYYHNKDLLYSVKSVNVNDTFQAVEGVIN